jgi:hypothetical protein
MTKSESRECLKLQAWCKFKDPDIALIARSYSALHRAARTATSKNQIMLYAAGLPAVVKHPEFIL